jgi:hypothetical protein
VTGGAPSSKGFCTQAKRGAKITCKPTPVMHKGDANTHLARGRDGSTGGVRGV